jgi:peroxiredoxin
MTATNSTMLELGTAAPDFDLPDPQGRRYCLVDFAGADALVVAFICNHCPFVHHLREGLAAFGRDCAHKNVALVAINSNDISAHPADAPARMRDEVVNFGYVFPYLFDESQATAKAYRAACTPDFFLFDRARKLAYRGQFDPSRPGSGVPVTGSDLRAAVDAVLGGAAVRKDQIPSMGCNIKWKPGNEPDYYG